MSGNEQQAVAEDNVLWLRFLLLHAVAQAAADGVPPDSVGSEGNPPSQALSPPPEALKNPEALVEWALQQAQSRQRDSFLL